MQVSTLETPLINTGGLMTNINVGADVNGSLQTVSVHRYYCSGMRLHMPAAIILLDTQNHPHLSSESRVLQFLV